MLETLLAKAKSHPSLVNTWCETTVLALLAFNFRWLCFVNQPCQTPLDICMIKLSYIACAGSKSTFGMHKKNESLHLKLWFVSRWIILIVRSFRCTCPSFVPSVCPRSWHPSMELTVEIVMRKYQIATEKHFHQLGLKVIPSEIVQPHIQIDRSDLIIAGSSWHSISALSREI